MQVDSIEMSYCFVEWFFYDFESTHDVIFLKNETRTSTHPIDNLVSGKVFSGPHLSFTKIQKQLTQSFKSRVPWVGHVQYKLHTAVGLGGIQKGRPRSGGRGGQPKGDKVKQPL